MVSRREICGMILCRMRSSRSVSEKRASLLPHLLRLALTTPASIQKNDTISRAARSSLAQYITAPSVSSGRKMPCMTDSILFTEHPLEDCIHMLQVVAQVKCLTDFGLAQRPGHFLVSQQFRLEVLALLPDLHGIALNQAVGILAGDPGLGQIEQDLLGEDQPFHLVEVSGHVFRIDHQ